MKTWFGDIVIRITQIFLFFFRVFRVFRGSFLIDFAFYTEKA